jgi:hypothetical protein
MQAGRAVLLKTTKSAQADLLAPLNSISSQSHNFPNSAPIDELFDSDCSIDSYEEICVFKFCDFQRRSIGLKSSLKLSYRVVLAFHLLINHIDQTTGFVAEWLWR